MFNDKKLRNTFLLQLLVILLPASIYMIAYMLLSATIFLVSVWLGIAGLFISIGVLRRFIIYRKIWNPTSIKVIGISMSILGILLGLFAILCLYSYLMSFMAAASMIG